MQIFINFSFLFSEIKIKRKRQLFYIKAKTRDTDSTHKNWFNFFLYCLFFSSSILCRITVSICLLLKKRQALPKFCILFCLV